ncbi:hypothetical protein AADG42_06575 [Ammonicoccus fulvus]|uniref:Phage head morphogenesis domain-containing protein n=1 Tax=Ammonicoccus fulvus TaxID=3138240 RepID=A0ABZ3FQ97_9ACTN
MTYYDVLVRLGDNLTGQLVGLWAYVEAGKLKPDEFTQLAADLVEVANAQGAAAAQLAFRGWSEAATGRPTPLTTYTPPDARQRLEDALTTLQAGTGDIAMRLERLGRNEPVQAATNAFHEVMKASTEVAGWVRGLEPDACQLCVWWSRGGRVWPADHPMPRHTGCACHQIPVTTERKSA